MKRRPTRRSCSVLASLAFSLLVAMWMHAPTAQAAPPPATQPAARLDVLAMGDWGEGKPAQTTVARALDRYVGELKTPIGAMILAGDNFYVPLSGVDDPAWQTLFEQMYDPNKLNFPFYASLGNHDYDAGKYKIELEYARIHPESRWKMPARWYRIDLPPQAPLLTVLMLDSNQPNLTPEEWAEQTQWLGTELAKPRTAPWVMCCAHHPLFSNGVAADNGILQRDLGTLFRKYNVDFYLCGHEHNLQHLEVANWSTSFVLAGGGGAHSHPMIRDNRGPFSRSVYGFVHFDFTPELATVRFIGVDPKPLHEFERTKAGATRVVMTTPSDKAIDKPLEAILGIYGQLKGAQSRPATQPSTRPTTEPAPASAAGSSLKTEQ